MKKKSAKITKLSRTEKDSYSVTEVGALIENFQGQLQVVAETVTDHTERFDRVDNKLDSLTMRVDNLTMRVEVLENSVRTISQRIKELTESINNLIQTKVDREDILRLERRLQIVEAKVGIAS